MTTILSQAVEALMKEFTIGTYSTFCDEVDFDEATPAEIEAVLKPFLLPDYMSIETRKILAKAITEDVCKHWQDYLGNCGEASFDQKGEIYNIVLKRFTSGVEV